MACAAAAVAGLAGCGGGGGSEAPAPAPTPPAPEMVTYSGKALDGALQGATACYDLNDNGACDSGEPATAAPSDANGNFTLSVPAAEAGKHRVVVEVSAGTIDKDTGSAVGTAYTLVAPASGTAGAQAVVASPLSTLVQAHVDNTGVSVAEAASFIQAQAGLAQSPLADYGSGGSPAATQAALVARLVQLTLNAQTGALAPAIGTNDINGSAMTAGDISRQSARAVIAALPAVASAVADPALANASGAALTSALQTAAAATVAATGLDAATVAASVGVAKLPADTSTQTSGPSATLVALRWTDADNWYYRSNEASAEDNVADANGMLRFYPVFRQSQGSGFSSNGTVTAWGLNSNAARAGDLHWNGSAWTGCPLFTRSLSSVRDAQGRASYQFCDGLESGQSQRSAVDLQGKSIASVFNDTIRKFPGGASGVNFAEWGPANPAAVFGSASFPAGAKLFYYTQTPTRYAIAYDVQASNQVQAFSAAIAAGGDARADGSLACAAPNVTSSVISTLEQLVALNPGKPCVFNKAVSGSDSSLDPNEWWSNSTASLGTLSGGTVKPAGTGNWYSSDLRLRVAFAAGGNGTTYYGCFSRATNGSSRNCSVIGSGSWAVQTLGDARVMTFTGLPAAAIKTGFNRVFVERGGKVYFGFQSIAGNTFSQIRLNLEATNAVFKPLGIGPIRPTARDADLKPADQAALTTLAGVWGQADDTTANLLRFTADGRYLHGQAGPANPATREQTGGELGWFSYDGSSGKVSALPEVDADLTAGLSHPEDGQTLTLTAEQFTASSPSGTFTATRLPAGSSPLHGLWALGSATDLKTQHFAFFPNGRVLMIDPLGDTEGGACTQARQGPPGAEYASYTWDAGSGALHVFDKVYDTNGCAGFFDSSAGAIANGTANTTADFTLSIAADGNTATVTGGDIGTALTLYRIKTR